MNNPLLAANSAVVITSIAIIDNDFRKISIDRVPEEQRADALNAITSLEGDSLQDLIDRGVELDGLSKFPERLDSLTEPDRELGYAFAHLLVHCDALGKLIQNRHTMRRLAARMRSAAAADVQELAPEDVPDDLSPYQLIFLDYYLEDVSDDTTAAEEIASRTARSPSTAQQQVVLMSSNPSVGSDRRRFRQEAQVPGPSFAFVAKHELDSSWKIKAHLQMLSTALPHSRVVSGYISSVKENLAAAAEELGQLLDDLDLGDFAHLQNLALQADGHPLGDYLSWLASSHLTSLAFEGDLRQKQDEVDALEFDTTLVHPLELSRIISTFHHSALFARKLGPLREHPRAAAGAARSQLPVTRLGDVYFDTGRTKALVVLSADCELAFAPGTERSLDESTSVLLVPGTPIPIHRSGEGSAHAATFGMEHESEVYRLEWNFEKYFAVEIRALRAHLESEGFDVSDRDRLRPLYALQLQQQFGSHLFRVGSPVPPPGRIPVKATIVRHISGRAAHEDPVLETIYEFASDDVYATYSGKVILIRITPTVAGELRKAVEGLYAESVRLLETDGPAVGAQNLRHKVQAIENHLENDDKWISILGDRQLPKRGKSDSLVNGLLLVSDSALPVPNEPTVLFKVLVVNLY